MNLESNQHNGKRYLNWVRCSSDHQAGTSVPDQLNMMNVFGDALGMIHVDDVILDGVTGSVPGAREDIEMIIRRKLERDDFDVVLLQDMSRLTRSGSEHAAKIEYDLRAVGIEIIYVAEHLPQGDHASIIKSVGFYAARQHAKGISFGVARGQMSALIRHSMPYCSTPPYGIDRLIVNGRGEPLFILRNLHDGSQQKLSADGKTLLQVFPPSEVKGKSGHYRRQTDELVEFVPGSAESVETVRRIYRRHFADGWGRGRIAAELNRLGIRPLKGGKWNTAQVGNILNNSIYLGQSVVNRYTKAIYNMRSPNTPRSSVADSMELSTRKTPKLRIRSAENWMPVEHEALKDYLDEAIRPLAAEKQATYWSAKAKGHTPTFSRDRHGASAFILKNILKQKGTGLPLTGRKSGPKQDRRRYYAIGRAFATPCATLSRRNIPAPELEQAVLEQVREVLLAAPELGQIIRGQITQQVQAQSTDKDRLSDLEQEKKKLTEQLEFVIDNIGPLGKSATSAKFNEIEQKLADVTRRIESAKKVETSQPLDVEQHVQRVIERLHQLAGTMEKLPSKALRGLLESVIERLEIDMDTREVELDLRLPPWAMANTEASAAELCLDAKPSYRSGNEAQWTFMLKIAEIDCRGLRNPNRFDCCRRRKAA